MEKLRIVVGGYIGLYPAGGATWDYAQYVIGLKNLGHDVFYIEDTGQFPVFQQDKSAWNDAAFSVNFLQSAMDFFGLRDRWAYRDAASGKTFGMSEEKVRSICSSADVFINISCSTLLREEYMSIPKRILIDSDPMFTQMQYLKEKNKDADAKNWSTVNMIENHNFLFTFGENIHSPDCRIPSLNKKWFTTRQPVCTELWKNDCAPASDYFTTILNWSGRKKIVYDNTEWGQKDVEFEKFKSLPRDSGEKFEAVINAPLDESSVLRKDELNSLGWQLPEPSLTVPDAASYRDYLQKSLAEFSVAKETYVKSNSGWFSCRSACYLAAGRPVITQETGWSRFIPAGSGLFSFTHPKDITHAIREIKNNYAYHSHKAEEIAFSYFDSKIVLTKLLDTINHER